MSAFDDLLREHLTLFSSVEDVHLLLIPATVPSTPLNITQTRVINFLSIVLQVQSYVFDVDRSSLGILSLYAEECISDRDCFRVGYHGKKDIVLDVYRQCLFDFFEDPIRSGKYLLSENAYDIAVFRILDFASR